MNFEYKGEIIEFQIIRRKRKSICIKIEINGEVQVVAPMRTSKEYILNFVNSKHDWIIEKRRELKTVLNKKVKREFINGGTFMYLGKEYPICLIFNDKVKKISIDFINESSTTNIEGISKFLINTNTYENDKLKKALENWYRSKTLDIVKERIRVHKLEFKDKITKVTVKEQKRRYASINRKNETYFNWRISMAPLEVIDYIIVHEMCHMDFRNHSKQFWNRVEEVMPNYKKCHEYLKENGINLTID
ncbi:MULTISPECIES: SprT family zinc-dependent metalloprotease [Clostridium]|uniref:SprT family zinc-dependent metalloprotease n=1 Tax=Clostridium aquiflavi TaxID=3073603 RepID=A0ABU1ED45_9CLOT|nr:MULTISPECIES: SprT family zinc-dependent metalloprotease [unclassified Clostridium]MDR5586305.1 SprT family zinc-dependent metalloprotease [Clostridium sp. 5N-1]NFG63207.1 M48 family metallopeptidase [Clostridium botulinum]NFQ09081.1 M48 family metallopeptidase [Clostridium botulinum]